ncbi:hypothetical protein COT52_00320 [candidate division WWE3 bacterium CG08_land_8_20_14_0_20_43_13]|uniref:Thioredoxin-like fold domain-containing protein n=1 Tax=candidate division WWE3 bacterium CG08_land_8_20_14_0_20_43_13 TaxID=1975087 RepID=A0A2H0XAF1_UNCKA|nr:MAG: hypothetical protein COT52_00320 [candidate division WWE3 bacterium CG08_land_8_20_14_0_20_43_13]
MNKKEKLITAIIIASLIAAAALLIYFEGQSEKDQIIYYWSYDCPHCHELNKYLDENGLRDKLNLKEKEISKNPKNLARLTVDAKKCGFDNSMIAIPMMVSQGKCYLGPTQIVELINGLLDIEEQSNASNPAQTEE